MTSQLTKSWRLPSNTGTLLVQTLRGPARPGPALLAGQYLDRWIGEPLSRPPLLEMFELAYGWTWPARFTGDRSPLRARLRANLALAFEAGSLMAADGIGTQASQGWTIRPPKEQPILFKRRQQLGPDDRIQDPEKILALLDDWLVTKATQGVIGKMYADLQNLPSGKAPAVFNPATVKLIRTALTKAIKEKTLVAVLPQGRSGVGR